MTPDIDTDFLPQRRYSRVAILLHWLLALALVSQIALGHAMPSDESGFAAYQLHKSIGIAILLLTFVRLGWRLFRRPPPPLERGFGGLIAKAVHWGFYAVLILGPLTGWLLVSSAPIRVPTVLFGVVPWPHLPVPAGLNELSEDAHEWLGWIAIGLIALHVAGAMRHQLILHDGLLGRMAPAGSAAWGIALACMVALAGGATFMLAASPSQTGERSPTESAATAPAPANDEQTEDPAPEPEATDQAEEAGEPATPPTWTVQSGGRLGFAVSNGGEQLTGRFSNWSGNIAFDPDHPETADIRIEIDLASASLGDATMDDMLAGPEFFAVTAGPRANWRATSVRRTGPNRYSAQGTLSLKGVSRSQPLTFTLSGTGLRRSVSGSATVSRGAFDIGTGSSGANLGADVAIDFAFDAVGNAN